MFQPLGGAAVCLGLLLGNALGQLLCRGITHAHTLDGILDRFGPLLLWGDFPPSASLIGSKAVISGTKAVLQRVAASLMAFMEFSNSCARKVRKMESGRPVV